MMGCCILGVVGTQTVDMLMEVVEMLIRTRNVVGGFESMCTDLMYLCDIVVEINEKEYEKLVCCWVGGCGDGYVVGINSTTRGLEVVDLMKEKGWKWL
ncbi:hypothetical protein QL285_005018 [Trifolium repens]|nr:hypothetical protein QL285_005018 [Trifolium repens]